MIRKTGYAGAVISVATLTGIKALASTFDPSAGADVAGAGPVTGTAIADVAARLALVGATIRRSPATISVVAACGTVTTGGSTDEATDALADVRARVAVRCRIGRAVTITATVSVITNIAAADLPATCLAVAGPRAVSPWRLAGTSVAVADIVGPRALSIIAAGPARRRRAATEGRSTSTVERSIRGVVVAVVVEPVADLSAFRIDRWISVVAVERPGRRVAPVYPAIAPGRYIIVAVGVVVVVQVEFDAIDGAYIIGPAVAIVVEARVAVLELSRVC